MEPRDTNVLSEIETNLESRTQEASHSAAERSGAALEQLKGIGRDKLDQVEQYIEDEPLKSLLIAAGLGVLIGALIRR